MSVAAHNPVLPKGSLILVTGASGYIASHVVEEALKAGYKVRGTARTEEKAEKTKKVHRNDPNYSTAVVADFQHEGVFDDAVKGVDAIIHVASDTTFETDPNKVITPVVNGTLSILRSAAKEASVKRFVLTSSSTAALNPSYDKEISIDASHFNQEAVDQAWAPPPHTPKQGYMVYAASKTEGERALWKFIKEEKPKFVANAVLPNYNMGRVIGSAGVTGIGVTDIYSGKLPPLQSQYMIDVIDDARLHLIAAVLDSSLENERIFAFNVVFTWTEIINLVKKLYPNASSVAEPPKHEKLDLSKVPNQQGADLLKKWYNQDGYKPIEQTIKENLEHIA